MQAHCQISRDSEALLVWLGILVSLLLLTLNDLKHFIFSIHLGRSVRRLLSTTSRSRFSIPPILSGKHLLLERYRDSKLSRPPILSGNLVKWFLQASSFLRLLKLPNSSGNDVSSLFSILRSSSELSMQNPSGSAFILLLRRFKLFIFRRFPTDSGRSDSKFDDRSQDVSDLNDPNVWGKHSNFAFKI